MYRYPEFPDQVYVELTNICNARCTICATPAMRRDKAIMTPDLFEKIAIECGRHKARKFLPYLHGESLLVPGATDYFRTMRRHSPETHINLTTNGSKLTPEIAEEILEDGLIDSLIVSVDGATKETFEKIRINLKWEKVRENVLHFIRRREEMGLSDPKVSVAMVTVGENKDEREKFREVWNEADEVRYSVYFNWAGKLENNGRTAHKVNFCERLYHYITILADGRVALCCFDSEADYVLGDVSKDSIYEVWHCEEMNRRRKQLYDRDFEKLKICGSCDYLNHPRWAGPLVRIRPYVHRALPNVANAAERVYKSWLMR